MNGTNESRDLIGFTNQQAHFNKALVERIVRLEIGVRELDARGLRYSKWLLLLLITDIVYFGYKFFTQF
jgi:hypothetical protein